MNLINCENLCKAYDERPLFDSTAFTLDEGEKVGVIGINGTGKSTLLKMLIGQEEPDEGTITVAKGIMMSYLSQHPSFRPGASVLEAVLEGHATEQLPSLIVDAKTMLTKLSVTDMEEKVDHLSGGQRKRLALVRCLLSGAEVLVLDEPTNHLDSDMAEWLETYLKSYRGAMVMVTHDRYFLDSVTDTIVELDRGRLYRYHTNYSGFLQLKAEREDMQMASERKRQSVLRVELEWMMRGARARSTKQKAHIERYENLAAVKAPEKQSQVEISSASSRLGRQTIELEGVTKCFADRCVVRDYTYFFTKGERIGYVGPNGCGKSTLMKMIAGIVEPDAGRITIGQTVRIGYYAQELSDGNSDLAGKNDVADLAYMDPNKRVIDYVRDTAEFVQTADGQVSATVMLERFLFPPEKQYARIGKLSGGEKRRLNLLRVLMEAPNVLILDEPTNDLDIQTLTILEDYIDHFDGIVLIVSHDRFLLDRLVQRVIAYEGDGVLRQYEGNYTDYWMKHKEQLAQESELGKPEKVALNANAERRKDVSGVEKKPRFSYAENREYEQIDAVIAEIEEHLAKVETDIAANASNYGKLQELGETKEKLEAELEEKMDRWVYLNDLAEQIAEYEKTKK